MMKNICFCACNVADSGYNRTGRAWHKKRLVKIPAVKSAVTYLLALHEIGHVVCAKAHNGTRLEKEYHAWRWALDNACIDVPTAAWRKIHRSLKSYLKWAEARKHRPRPPHIPDVDHPIWELLAEAEFCSKS